MELWWVCVLGLLALSTNVTIDLTDPSPKTFECCLSTLSLDHIVQLDRPINSGLLMGSLRANLHYSLHGGPFQIFQCLLVNLFDCPYRWFQQQSSQALWRAGEYKSNEDQQGQSHYYSSHYLWTVIAVVLLLILYLNSQISKHCYCANI